MHWIFDLFLAAIDFLIPWHSRHEDSSIVGKSRMDYQDRWIARILIGLVFVVVVLSFFLKK